MRLARRAICRTSKAAPKVIRTPLAHPKLLGPIIPMMSGKTRAVSGGDRRGSEALGMALDGSEGSNAPSSVPRDILGREKPDYVRLEVEGDFLSDATLTGR